MTREWAILDAVDTINTLGNTQNDVIKRMAIEKLYALGFSKGQLEELVIKINKKKTN